MPDCSKTLRADLFLLLAAVIWGSTFTFQKHAMDYLGPITFSGLRFLVGGLCLAPFAFHRAQKLLAGTVGWGLMVRQWTVGGLISGVLLCLGINLQQYGLVETTAGKAGFITGLYVVAVPLIARLFGHRLELGVLIGVTAAVIGLYLLSFTSKMTLAPGDGPVLVSALIWAFHVLAVGWLSPKMDSVILAAGQALVCGLISIVLAVQVEPIPGPAVFAATWTDLLWGGVMSVTVGFTCQVIGQKDAPPVAAAVILQLETVVAALAGWLILNETMTGRMLLGAALMLFGMLASQLYPFIAHYQRRRR